MSTSGTRESWDAGGLAFSQPSIGAGDAEQAEDVWDDRAILKAFDDALNTHTWKPVNGVEARKWDKHAAQGLATPPLMDNRGPPPGTREGHGSQQGSQQGDRRFAGLLAKGGAEATAARQAAGVPGPWEPVANTREGEGQDAAMIKDEAGQRFEYAARTGPYDNQRVEEFGAHHYPPGAPHPPPHAGGSVNFEKAWDRQGLPPPPPPMPHGGAGPHAAAFQSLDSVYDDDLADLLLAWYYSGYYTGRYRALQDARNPRYRRNYPPMPGHGPPAHGPPAAQHGASTPSGANHGEAWERQGWQEHPAAPGFGPSPASRTVHADARGGPSAGRRPGPGSGSGP